MLTDFCNRDAKAFIEKHYHKPQPTVFSSSNNIDDSEIVSNEQWWFSDPLHSSDQTQKLQQARLLNERQSHDPKHRAQCWDKKNMCRYDCPHDAVSIIDDETHGAGISFQIDSNDENRIEAVLITHKRRAPYLYMSSSTHACHLLADMNSFFRPVKDCGVTYYKTKYTFKPQDKDSEPHKYMLDSLQKYTAKQTALSQQQKACPAPNCAIRSLHSKGLGKMLSASGGYSKSTLTPATMASFIAVGGKNHFFAYERAPLYVGRMIDFLRGSDVKTDVAHLSGETYLDPFIQDYHCRGAVHIYYFYFYC